MSTNRSIIYDIRRKCQVMALKLTSNEFMSKVYFKIVLGGQLNLKNPTTFNEKLQWLKLYYCPNEPKVIQCTDKYAVREYIKQKGYGEYLNNLLGVWDNVNDINWDSLPNKFVMKCNHGCGYNIICDDKEKIDIIHTKKLLKKWMKEDFGLYNAEPHYSKINPKIICEKYLDEDIIDYKFFCFKGIPKFMYIAQGFGKGTNERISFLDINGNKVPFKRSDYDEFENDIELPKNFAKMVEISARLSEEFPFVRVDLFEVDGRIYFSELTFTPCGGLMGISPKEYDNKLGDLINIAEIN